MNKLKSSKIIKIESTEDRQKFRRVINGLKLKQCPYCLSGFKPKVNSQNIVVRIVVKNQGKIKMPKEKDRLEKIQTFPQ